MGAGFVTFVDVTGTWYILKYTSLIHNKCWLIDGTESSSWKTGDRIFISEYCKFYDEITLIFLYLCGFLLPKYVFYLVKFIVSER